MILMHECFCDKCIGVGCSIKSPWMDQYFIQQSNRASSRAEKPNKSEAASSGRYDRFI